VKIRPQKNPRPNKEKERFRILKLNQMQTNSKEIIIIIIIIITKQLVPCVYDDVWRKREVKGAIANKMINYFVLAT